MNTDYDQRDLDDIEEKKSLQREIRELKARLAEKEVKREKKKSPKGRWVYQLTCEDASHLGGPMGTEYTTHVFTKAFASLEAAKKYAREYNEEWPGGDWTFDAKRNTWHIDARTHIYYIRRQRVER